MFGILRFHVSVELWISVLEKFQGYLLGIRFYTSVELWISILDKYTYVYLSMYKYTYVWDTFSYKCGTVDKYFG